MVSANAYQDNVRLRVAAIVLRGDALLLVKHVKAGEAYWMLPGGGVRFGETLRQALIRELREETGLDIEAGKLVLVNDSIPPDKRRHMVNLYFTAKICGGDLRLGSDPRVAEVAFMPVDKLPSVTLLPDFAGELQRLVRTGLDGGTRYLGNLWRS